MALSRAQFDEAMRILSERRRDALLACNARQEELREALPYAAELEERLLELAMEETSARLRGDDEEALSLRKKREETGEKRRSLILEAGYPPDFEEPRFGCPLCQDTGYIGHEKCSCLKAVESGILLRASGIPDYVSGGDLTNVDTDVYDDTEALTELKPKRVTQSAYIDSFVIPSLRRFVDEIDDSGRRSVLMYGPAGTGKTFLAARLASELIARGMGVVYQRAGDMFELLSKAQFSREQVMGADELWPKLAGAEVLILDDLGTEFSTEFSRSRLFTLIADRLSSDLITVITTNLSLRSIKELYSERISSRLMGGYLIIPFYGRDLRIEKGLK